MVGHHFAQHFISGDVKTIAKCGMGHNAGGIAFAAGQLKCGNGKVSSAAADVYGSHAHAGPVAAGRAGFAHETEEVVGVTVLFDGQFVIEEHQLGAAGFVPVAAHQRALAVVAPGLDRRRGRVPLAPTQGLPDYPHGPGDPAAEDAFFRHGHGRGHGKDEPPQAAGQIGLLPAGAGGRGINGDQGLGEDFPQHKKHE